MLTTACGGDDGLPAGTEAETSWGSSSGSTGSTSPPTTEGSSAAPGDTTTGAPGSSTGEPGATEGSETGTTGEVIEELAVLFLGNSHTYLEDIGETDLPLLVSDLAASQGKTMVVDSVTAPFASLEEHYGGAEALDLIAEGGWDVVVLQERYLPSVEDPVTMLEYAALLDAEIEAVGAQTMLYILWARDGELEVQPAIIDNNVSVAEALGAELSPVGPAWDQIRADYPTMTLEQNDPQSHANRRGAYLNAMVFYGALFLESPVGLPAETILEEDPTDAEAELLQIAAEQALAEF